MKIFIQFWPEASVKMNLALLLFSWKTSKILCCSFLIIQNKLVTFQIGSLCKWNKNVNWQKNGPSFMLSLLSTFRSGFMEEGEYHGALSGRVMERRGLIYTQMLTRNDRGGPWRLRVCVWCVALLLCCLRAGVDDHWLLGWKPWTTQDQTEGETGCACFTPLGSLSLYLMHMWDKRPLQLHRCYLNKGFTSIICADFVDYWHLKNTLNFS